MSFTSKYFTEIGWLEITGNDDEILTIEFKDEMPETTDHFPPIAQRLEKQLDDYFKKGIWTFDVKLSPQGTEFQRRVWKELEKIPFGKTISYLEMAKRLGDEKVIRAAASANGKNPISIIIPCHRVIGKNGKLVGYGGGLHRKKYLLELEQGFKSQELF